VEINITGNPVIDNLKERRGTIQGERGKLAYERWQLMRRVDEIDDALNQLEGAEVANNMVQKDIDTRDAIVKAQAEAAERKAADAANKE